MRALSLLLVWFCAPAGAHELQTASLRLSEAVSEAVTATLNTPLARDGQPSTVVPVFDERCTLAGEFRVEREATRIIRTWPLQCRGGLAGTRIAFRGLDPRTPEALVNALFADGSSRVLTLDRNDPQGVVEPDTAASPAVSLGAYFPIGIDHILLGPDHLLFVMGLMLVVAARKSGIRLLVAAMTAFTLAHSLTLGMAMFGVWGLPPKPVEILIALSIVLLALELSLHERRQRGGLAPTLTLSKPWLAAFAFGLLHGFGFAGALSEIGLPDEARGWALLLFNLGVEAGQLIFVSAAALLVMALRKWRPRQTLPAGLAAILLGGIAVYWTLDRTALWLQASGLLDFSGV